MNMIKFLEDAGLDVNNVACIAAGSDAPHSKSALFALAIGSLTSPDIRIIWRQGSNFAKVADFVGVSMEEYESLALPHDDFVAEAIEALKGKLIATYSVHNYTGPMLVRHMDVGSPSMESMLDVVDLWKAMQRLEWTPENAEKTWTLLCRRAHLEGGYPLKGCTLSSIHASLGFSAPSVPFIEKRVVEVRDVLGSLVL